MRGAAPRFVPGRSFVQGDGGATLMPRTLMPLRRLLSQRAVLGLYALLLVLPSGVFGALHWHQLWLDHRVEMEALPEVAEAAAERLTQAVRRRLDDSLREEAARPFHEFAPKVFQQLGADGRPIYRPSSLIAPPRQAHVTAWFGSDLMPYIGRRHPVPIEDARVDFLALRPGMTVEEEARHAAAALGFVRRNLDIGFFGRSMRMGRFQPHPTNMAVVGMFLAQFEYPRGRPTELPECFLAIVGQLLASEEPIVSTQFHFELLPAEGEEIWAAATRRVLPESEYTPRYDLGDCPRVHNRDFSLLQGVLLDTRWLFDYLPREVAGASLGRGERLLQPGDPEALAGGLVLARLDLPQALGFETSLPPHLQPGQWIVGLEPSHIEQRFRNQMLRFFGMASMLVLLLATGLGLLIHSVGQELERAEASRNFVAAVTHELRTPLSTIALHTEMLLEGWTPDPAKQREYYLRIARETQRLSNLVERVLEKARLTNAQEWNKPILRPRAGDLSAAVGQARHLLTPIGQDAIDDVAFRLANDLPPVALAPEAVTSMVVNLVENARKYAPVAPDGEPIEVRTAADGQGVYLEVSDRGPGIPDSEKVRIFDAFYRLGNEATRTATGTGLGLHLVALQAEALGGRVTVHDRPGGGASFRVHFRRGE